jgi:hypothetical protein
LISRSGVTLVWKRSANSDFSSRVGRIDVRLALPQRSPRPFSVPWICVVVGVDAEVRARHVLDDVGDDRLDFVRQRAAVGVAQHDPARARVERGLGDGQRVVAVALVAVEEVLTVDHALRTGRAHGGDTFGDAREVLVVGDAEGDADVIVPGLGDEAGSLGPTQFYGLQGALEARVVGDRASGPLGHAEGGENGAALKLRRAVEQRCIGVVGAGIAALDVVEAEAVEHARNAAFVVERKVDAGGLRAVAQRGVEQIEAISGHQRFTCFWAPGFGVTLLGRASSHTGGLGATNNRSRKKAGLKTRFFNVSIS